MRVVSVKVEEQFSGVLQLSLLHSVHDPSVVVSANTEIEHGVHSGDGCF